MIKHIRKNLFIGEEWKNWYLKRNLKDEPDWSEMFLWESENINDFPQESWLRHMFQIHPSPSQNISAFSMRDQEMLISAVFLNPRKIKALFHLAIVSSKRQNLINDVSFEKVFKFENTFRSGVICDFNI